MKQKTYITKFSIIALIVSFVGLLIALPGGLDTWRYAHVRNFSELTSTDIRKNAYVEGEITEYIGYTNGKKFMALSSTWLMIDGDYDAYTIPLRDGKYVQVRIVDEGLKKKLQNYTLGRGAGVKLTGKVTPCDNYDNDFYEKIEGLNTKDVIRGVAITQVREVDRRPKSFFGGLFITIIGAILFIRSLIHM